MMGEDLKYSTCWIIKKEMVEDMHATACSYFFLNYLVFSSPPSRIGRGTEWEGIGLNLRGQPKVSAGSGEGAELQ